ncbi:MAG: Mur ligase domain-containing protein [Candidatus Saccharibacteria bacterium]|nr:Mur ligase domain-containing protein [Candidatus Saccharibacteria bacterium]
MHVYFSGIGGTGIGPLALLAHQAGYTVSGSDKQESEYYRYLRSKNIGDLHIGQEYDQIQAMHEKNPIEWFVHTSALSIENPNAPELKFCRDHDIKVSKRDELINHLLAERNLKLIAISGTHGKTTTTAMMVWLLKQLGIPVSYSVGAKISFGEMGEFDPKSEYFVYEADEYDRNFLRFKPYVSIIPGIAYDHPDIYPTEEEYDQAFRDFIFQSEHVLAHQKDLEKLELSADPYQDVTKQLTMPGEVNRENAQLVITAVHKLTGTPLTELVKIVNGFPGLSRRFEKITEGVYSDYAHTPEKIRGALQMAREVAGDDVVVVYEGLHNTRQHFIKKQLKDLFDGTKKLYIVPSCLAREDESLELLTPQKLSETIEKPDKRIPSELNDTLKENIKSEVDTGNLVLCLTAGGGGSLDEWLRVNFVHGNQESGNSN